jgi:hypothetical protein
MVAYTENREVARHRVRGVSVDVVEVQADVPSLADAAGPCVAAEK